MKSNIKKLHVYLLAILAIILPNIVFLQSIEQPQDTIFFQAFSKGVINYDFFSYAKVLFLKYSLLIIIPIFLINSYKELKFKASYAFIGIYGFFIVLSTILSPFKELAVRGLGDRYEGVFTLLCYLTLFVMSYHISQDKKDRKILIGGIIGGSIIVGLVGIFQYWGYDIYRNPTTQKLITPKFYYDLAYKYEFLQNFITPKQVDAFNFNFNFDKYTIYSSLYNTNFVGSYMVLMMFLGIGMFFTNKKPLLKWSSFLYTLLMYSNWIGCRSRAGFLGGGVILIIGTLIFIKFYKNYITEIFALLVSFICIFAIMNSVDARDGNLATQFSKVEKVKTQLRNAYYDNGALAIEDAFTTIKVFKENEKISFFDKNNKPLELNVQNSMEKAQTQDGKLVDVQVQIINFKNKDYEKFSFVWNNFQKDMIAFRYTDDLNTPENALTYPIIFKDNKYYSVGISGKIFEIKDITRIKSFDKYDSLASARVYIWSRTIPLLTDSMLIGYGPDTFSLVFPQDDTFGKLRAYNVTNIIVDKPHNMYLQMAVNTGVLSVLVYIIGLFIFFIDGIGTYAEIHLKDKKNNYFIWETFLWLGILSYHVTAFFNDSLVSVAPIAWLYFGISAGSLYKLREEKSLDEKSEENSKNI